MRFCNKRLLLPAGVVGLAALFINSASAALITGIVNIGGSFTDQLTGTSTTLSFQPPAGTTGGIFTLSSDGPTGTGGNTGDFAPLAGTTGVILNLNTTTEPVGTPINLPGFLTFTNNSNIRFDLTMIQPNGDFSPGPCAASAAPFQICTPPPGTGGAPPGQPNAIILTNLPGATPGSVGGSTAQLALTGNVVNVGTGETDQFTGSLTTQFPVAYQMLLTELASGAPISTTYSGTFIVTAIPEPATILLLGCGLIGISLIRRHRRS